MADRSSSNPKRKRASSPESVPQAAKKKKTQYSTTFKDSYSKQFPCIERVKGQDHKAKCTICGIEISIAHGGADDCRKHVNSASHKAKAKTIQTTPSISSFMGKSMSSLTDAVTQAEVIFTGFLVEHNIPLAAADHVGKLLNAMFPPDSAHTPREVIKNYACGRTKTSHIVKELARNDNMALVDQLKKRPFSIATDASNDKTDKLFPLVVCFNDGTRMRLELLSLLELEGRSTGENIANLILDNLNLKGIPISNCVAFVTDNANNMVGEKKGAYAFLKKKCPNLITTGCACHRLHLASEWAAKELTLNVESFFIEFYHYLDKSSLRVKTFEEFQRSCGTPVTQVPKHCPTRWLSLSKTCDWVLTQWEALKAFFKKEVEEDPKADKNSRKARVLEHLRSRTTKLHILFLAYVLPLFDKMNLELQSEKPQIHMQRRLTCRFIRDLMIMFVRPSAISGKLITDVDIQPKYNLLPLSEIMVGEAVRSYMASQKMQKDKTDEFLTSVQKFFITAVNYLRKNMHLEAEYLQHAEVADVAKQQVTSFKAVKYFIELFPAFLPPGATLDSLEREFKAYQACSLPPAQGEPMNEQWLQLSRTLKDECGSPLLDHLPLTMMNILAIPHSNATCERIFSLVRRNRTDFRATMSVQTLESLISLKQKGEVCYGRKPDAALLKACKEATRRGLSAGAQQ